MNGVHPSESKIGWTAKSLNFTLPMMHSIKLLANSDSSTVKEYQKDTQHDSCILFQFICQKFGVWDEEMDIHCDFDCFYYEPDRAANIVQLSPSTLLNTSYTEVHAFVARQFKQIIEDYNIISVNDENEYEDKENLNEEPEF